MNRRRFLELATLGTSSLAGCAESATINGSTDSTTAGSSDAIVVAPDGADSVNMGSSDAPLRSIQKAIEKAHPGDTIHVEDGEYDESIQTIRAGTAADPITITGSGNAVIRGGSEPHFVFRIRHSHIHLRGLTINGLQNPDRPEDPSSYIQVLIHCLPPFDTDDYLEDIVLAPDGIGNAGRPLMTINRTKHLEIGPTKIIGLAGAVYIHGDTEDHTGEIIYLGKPPGTALGVTPKPDYPWEGLDQSRHVHIHHIDNSAGHPHSELVNTKLGTRDVLVEYCTSLGGSQNTEPYPTADVRFQSHNATLRWSELHGGEGYGVHIVQHRDLLREHDDAAVTPEQSGTGHSIYGNVITGFQEKPLAISTGIDAQRVVCGNIIPDAEHGSILRRCPGDLPEGNGIGHEHTERASYPSFQQIALRFNRTVSPDERGAPEGSDAFIAFICYELKLLSHDGGAILTVDVGAETEDGVVWGDGVYGPLRQNGEPRRAFGGEDKTTRSYFPKSMTSPATHLLLRGRAIADDIAAELYLDGNKTDEAAFEQDEIGEYRFALAS